MKTINLIFPCSPIKFYFWSWNDGILRWPPWSTAQIVRTGDRAKYLVLHSAEVVHVHHCTHSTQTIPYTLLVIRKRRRMRRDHSEAFSLPIWLDPFHLTPPYICLSSRRESTQHNWSSQSPYGNGCTGSNRHSEFFRFLCSLGGHPQVHILQEP